MNLLSRIQSRLGAGAESERHRASLETAEHLMRSGGAVAEIKRSVADIVGRNDVERAWIALFRGDLEAALEASYRAAGSRPYDVDSRIVHGTVRLARNELQHAEHEFDAVIEEFGAEQDASDGRRAVILAQGFAPLDELPASEADWDSAATLLTTLWRLAGVTEARTTALAGGHADGVAIVRSELERGFLLDVEAGDGTV